MKLTGEAKDGICRWIANHLPKRVVYFCAIRVAAHATTGKYSDQPVPMLNVMDAIQRWELLMKKR
jgi:hypothetical protein